MMKTNCRLALCAILLCGFVTALVAQAPARYAGAVTDSRQVVDYAERRAMVELCLRVMGYLPAAKVEHHITLEEILAQSWEDKS